MHLRARHGPRQRSDARLGSVVLNDLTERVTVIEAAISDRDGIVPLGLSATNVGDHRVGVSDRPTIEVPSYRLDGLLAGLGIEPGDVGLVWIDVQGHGAHVVAGAEGLLSAGVPFVLEYWPVGLGKDQERLEQLVATHAGRLADLSTGAVVARLAVGVNGLTDVLLAPQS